MDNLEKRVNEVSSFLAVEKTTQVFGKKQWGKIPIEKVLHEKLSSIENYISASMVFITMMHISPNDYTSIK